ncbi:hypothetical protein Sango_2936700 [Sesamum angolense]|uniref:RNase H type-1 domain-containing protein n=1 Tax=Sesamum angolense TaxID=2727404 RepID=A0AAE1VU49_9LAMI|nr:hypothetical protein Sango_2936700 [Sesamum angolense]
MIHPERLLSRVLKARHFPTGDVFSATLDSRPSFTWRSIIAAHDLFRAGCRWRVGTGSAIRVWRDPWLPRPRSFRPITRALESFRVVKMMYCTHWFFVLSLDSWMVRSLGFSCACVGLSGGAEMDWSCKASASTPRQELGVGVIARNAVGECLVWLSKHLLHQGDDGLAEVLAAREAVLLALRKNWHSVIFEGDCASIIRKILCPGCDYSFVGPIISDIRSLSAVLGCVLFNLSSGLVILQHIL